MNILLKENTTGRDTVFTFIIEKTKNEFQYLELIEVVYYLPLLKNTDCKAYLTALSRSQSLKMTNGDLPPNSSVTFFKLLAPQVVIMTLPTSVEPVNANLRTSSFRANKSPISAPEPLRKWK